MKKLIILCSLISSFSYAKTLTLSRDVFQAVPFSSQYSESGALIRNVHYESVNALVSQINSLYDLDLDDRKEAHITIITPPEYQASILNSFTVSEMLNRYSSTIQDLAFDVVCVGSRKSSNGKNQVFYLVVKSNDLLNLRFDLASVLSLPLIFKPEVFWPHITIGYINDDVFEFSKGPESCLADVELVID